MFFKRNAPKISDNNLKKRINLLYKKLLLIGYVEDKPDDIKKTIVEVLEKMRGSNMINFPNFVDEIIHSHQLNQILNLLSSSDLEEMKDIKYRLSKYNNSI